MRAWQVVSFVAMSLAATSSFASVPTIEIASGDNQTVTADLADMSGTFQPLVVRARDGAGPVRGVWVGFQCSVTGMASCSLDGSHSSVSVQTNEKGEAAVNLPRFVGGTGKGGWMPNVRVTFNTQHLSYQLYILPPPSPNLDLVRQFAPAIMLKSDEAYMPSSLEDFDSNMHLECDFKEIAPGIFNLRGLPPGNGAPDEGQRNARCRFSTNSVMNGPYDKKPFFSGRTPTADNPVPVYVNIYNIKGPGTFTAQYTTFYPWNEGKSSCIGIAPYDRCVSGHHEVLDDHVGDWELTSIQFIDGKPALVHVGAHGNHEPAMASTYRAPNWGDLKWDGNHPIVYSAAGSHGIWATAGTHVYMTIATGDVFRDYTDGTGTKWETWRSLVYMTEPKYKSLFFVYQGDWGNFHQGKDPCDLSLSTNFFCEKVGIPVGSEYQLNDGPSTPDPQRDILYMTAFPIPSSVSIAEIPARMPGMYVGGIAAGPDGSIWFTEYSNRNAMNSIGHIAANGTVIDSESDLSAASARPTGITASPDGFLWYAATAQNVIGKASSTGYPGVGMMVDQLGIPTLQSVTQNIAYGPDGVVWFTEAQGNKIGRLAPGARSATEFPVPTAGAALNGMTPGIDGAMWFIEQRTAAIGRITTEEATRTDGSGPIGTVTEFAVPGGGIIYGITQGPDGALWFTSCGSSSKIGRMTTAGAVQLFPIAAKSCPYGIAAGRDGALWFTESGTHSIGRITTTGGYTSYPLSDQGAFPRDMASSADGNLWFIEGTPNAPIGRVTFQ